MNKTNLPKVSISILWPDIRAVMLFKFLVWLKFHLNLDFCCAIAPRRNKTGVDIIDQIIFFPAKSSLSSCKMSFHTELPDAIQRKTKSQRLRDLLKIVA